MSPLNRLILKSTLVFGIIFLFISSIYNMCFGIALDIERLIINYIEGAFIFIIVAVIVTVPIQKSNLRRLGITEITKDVLKPNQNKIIHSKLNIDDIHSILLSNWTTKITSMIFTDTSINFSIDRIFGLLGEKIEINLIKQSDLNYEYELKCHHKSSLQALDFSSNHLNLNTLTKILEYN